MTQRVKPTSATSVERARGSQSSSQREPGAALDTGGSAGRSPDSGVPRCSEGCTCRGRVLRGRCSWWIAACLGWRMGRPVAAVRRVVAALRKGGAGGLRHVEDLWRSISPGRRSWDSIAEGRRGSTLDDLEEAFRV